MRGSDERTGELFSYIDIDERVPPNHPLRLIRRIVNEVLASLDGELVRLGQDHRRAGAAHVARHQEARLQVHLDDGRLRSHQTAEIDRSGCLNGRRGTTKAQRRRIRRSNTAHLLYRTPQNAAPRRPFQRPAKRRAFTCGVPQSAGPGPKRGT
jgi:hypothetical protein